MGAIKKIQLIKMVCRERSNGRHYSPRTTLTHQCFYTTASTRLTLTLTHLFVLLLHPGKHERATLRQTQVLVIPANDKMTLSFKEFDNLINAINQARRNARDYVTDVSLEKLDDRMYGEGDRDWR